MQQQLNLKQNLDDYDEFYELLVDTHQDLDDAQSAMLNAEVILLLSNHIGDMDVLAQAFKIARDNVAAHPPH
jgi:hypothetical protein